jgi:hypothetical protein
MKRNILTLMAATALIIIMSSFAIISYTEKEITDDLWKQLGTTEKDGKYSISQSFLNGRLYTFSLKPAMNMALGNRASVTTELLNNVKQYATSPTFQKDYKKWRDNFLKSYNLVPPVTREQITKKKIKETEDVIKTYENVLKNTTDEKAKKEFEQVLEMAKKQLAEYKSGKSAQIDYEVNQEEMRYQEIKNKMDEWAKQNPESNPGLIKQRLNEFLEATKGIDYDAALVERNGKKYFTNPKYEAKNSQWKMAFRAGKEVTETARTFAQQWLKELN